MIRGEIFYKYKVNTAYNCKEQNTLDNRVSPLHSSGFPTKVTFGFIIEDVIEVDEQNLAIELEFKMSMRWVDHRILLTASASKTNSKRSLNWPNLSAMTREQRAIDTDIRHVA